MKSKELREKFTKETGISTVFANRTPYIQYIEWLETKAIKQAQKEVLHEVVKRKWINSPMSDEYKSLDDIVLEIIKEIES